MYCPQCGTKAEENARFCTKCGRTLSGSTEQARPANDTLRARADIPNHLVWTILATIFCCLPAGIVSIVYAAQVNSLVAAGNFARAWQASRNAKTWAWVSVALVVLQIPLLSWSVFAMLQWFGVILIVALSSVVAAVAYAVGRWLVK